ncbi:glycosyltransferase family 2 protein [candidate division KSB1 bacterium]|nr:glycosyltransferase family 2 protein [candidate division KSB1 bacterium]
MTNKLSSLSIFFPVYNDWGTIPSMAAQAMATAEKITDDYEIILVDDGSEEKTQDMLDFLQKHFKQIRVIYHQKNRGYGGALRTGFKESKKDFIFYTDGDAQYDVRQLLLLTEAMNEQVDVVNGFKIKRSDPFYRVLLGKIYQYTAKFMFALPIKDVDCDFRLMRRTVFDDLELISNSGTICVEMIHKISRRGCRFAEVGVSHFFRASGKSQFFNFKRLYHVGRDFLRLWFKLVVRKEGIHAKA